MPRTRSIGSFRETVGLSPSGFSFTSSIVRIIVASRAPPVAVPAHPIMPLPTSWDTVIPTRMMGSSSKTAFTAEARPRWSWGTRSGIRACSGPWETLAENCTRRVATSSITKLPDAAIAAMKTRSKSVPTRMNGRRLPKRDVERSLSRPAAGCTSIAITSPAVLMAPSAVFLTPSGTNFATR